MNSCGCCANEIPRATRRPHQWSDVEVEMEKTADEVKRLQSCINDLISVMALAAIWTGNESCQMLGTLLESLLAILRLDFACARLNDSIDGSPVEVVRLAQRQHPSAQPQEVGRALDRWLSGDQTASRFVIPNPAGEGEVAIASFPLGLQDEVGVLVAGSRRADFPTDIERLLLRVVANQAAIGLQEARRAGDQKRVAEALERRVAERTSQLTAVNEELRRSQAYLAEAQRLSHTGSFGWRVSSGEILWSEETFRIFQYDRITTRTVELILQRVHPEDAALVKQTIERAAQDGKDFDDEYRLVMPDGSTKYVHVVAHALSDESGSVEFVGAVMDVTERKRAEALRDGESHILEMIARDAPLEEILEKLVRVVEAQFAGLLCSVLLLDEDARHVRHGAAPSLPQPYTKAIDGLCIGPKAGSCGTAMYRREPVVVADILQDPLWESYREVAKPYWFRSCWSTPILAHSGEALGSFAMTYREPRSPSPAETRALEMATHLAGIAIERKLAREERERLRQARADLAHVTRMTTMGELTASLAHEIKQPISAAVTDAKTCLRWLRRDDPDVAEAGEAASRLIKDVTRAADIISGIN